MLQHQRTISRRTSQPLSPAFLPVLPASAPQFLPQNYLTTGAYTFPKLHVSNGLAAASGNFSGIARPNSSFSEQNRSTTGAHVNPRSIFQIFIQQRVIYLGLRRSIPPQYTTRSHCPSSIRSTTPRVQGMILLVSRALTPGSLLRCFLSSRGRKRV